MSLFRTHTISIESSFGNHHFQCSCGAASRPGQHRDEAEAKAKRHAREHKRVTIRR